MKQRSFLRKWMFLLTALLLVCPVQGKNNTEQSQSEKVTEKHSYNGEFILKVTTDPDDYEDPDYFFNDTQYGNDDHVKKFRNKFYSQSFFDNAKGQWCYEFYFEQWNSFYEWGDEDDRVCSITTVSAQNKAGTWETIGTIDNDEDGEVKNNKSKWGLIERTDENHFYRFYPSP